MSQAGQQEPLGTGAALVVTLGVVLVIIGFIALGATLGLVPLYAGFLILWYFAGIDLMEPGALPALLIGAVGGTLTAWLLQYGVANWGPWGFAPAVIIIIVGVFCQIKQWLEIAINRAFMLYVTVMAAPLLQEHESFPKVLMAIALATVYFGGIVIVGRKIAESRKVKA